jgi:hypothetical protein
MEVTMEMFYVLVFLQQDYHGGIIDHITQKKFLARVLVLVLLIVSLFRVGHGFELLKGVMVIVAGGNKLHGI